ncbi:hypothetical protein [uncultured Photobacterium sp.]|uniref:hypothetical protein n=1 Tax=uncultured Photobacterium sp. TaxID=173973 RepID=UPI002609A8AA|nr:hypothetical protein [uncultured Photobacterium sp.]
MFVIFNKNGIAQVLPEKKPKIIFMEPDALFLFGVQNSLILFEDILDNLDIKWKEKLNLWQAELDFRKSLDDEEEFDKLIDTYWSVDFGDIPQVNVIEIGDSDIPFVFDKTKKLYINIDFLNALKKAGAKDVWFDTTAPYGRY